MVIDQGEKFQSFQNARFCGGFLAPLNTGYQVGLAGADSVGHFGEPEAFVPAYLPEVCFFFWLLRKTAELSGRKTQKKQNNFLSSQRKTLGPGLNMTGNGSIMHANRGGNHFKKMTAMKKSKKFNQYKADNEAFLAGKAAEEGVLALDNGVVIRKLEQGRGKVHPAPGSVVYVNYTGRLMDGTVFDSTDGQALPALFRVRDLIMGWQIALVRMHEGDIFRVWIPAKYAYGSAKMDMIPAWSTLEFDIELVKIAQI